jgi:monofunctional biosynthetic peptidoglycan transglycosylase
MTAFNSRFSKVRVWIKKAVIYFFVLSVLSVIIFRFIPIPFTPLMFIRAAQNLVAGNPLVWSYQWVSLDEMSLSLPSAVIASEDQKFFEHYGFDIASIKAAFDYNKNGKKVRGASTISQQTAKNVFLWQGRSWIRKGFEVYFTCLIELFWSKERIVEVYLNVIEMGNGVYGVAAASKHCFGKSPSSVTPAQAALIAATLPNPRKYFCKSPSRYISRRQNWVLRQMNNLEIETNFINK